MISSGSNGISGTTTSTRPARGSSADETDTNDKQFSVNKPLRVHKTHKKFNTYRSTALHRRHFQRRPLNFLRPQVLIRRWTCQEIPSVGCEKKKMKSIGNRSNILSISELTPFHASNFSVYARPKSLWYSKASKMCFIVWLIMFGSRRAATHIANG